MNKDVLKILYENDYLVEPGLEIDEREVFDFLNYLKRLEEKPLIITKQIYFDFLKSKIKPLIIKQPKIVGEGVEVVRCFRRKDIEKLSLETWIAYFYDRFHKLKEILLKHGLEGVSIRNLRKGRNLTTIGMISEKKFSKSGNCLLRVEDPSGMLRVIIRKDSPAYRFVPELVKDEVIGIRGDFDGRVLFANDLIFPDVPERERKSADKSVKAAFLADLHVGSKMFLADKLKACISWIKKNEDIEYVFIVGDLVDGVGVYPEQEGELEIKDIYKQYEKVAEYLKPIEDRKIIICPGNHDASMNAEPQVPIFEEYAPSLYEMENVTMLSNPGMVKVEGIKFLLYHGYSFDTHVAEVEHLKKYGYDGYQIMKFLLRKRHLSPLYGATLAMPLSKDWLVMDELPDVFLAAHIHRPSIGWYRNILCVCCSCFQAKTIFQEKIGHEPVPGIAIVADLKSWEIREVSF